ncbi:hypothetical protein H2200_004600 [Cladophialophora chaetospira]|uniref:Uncharacterized protein n=1 Tax=Cladophialophora chaetospira TaxID=386627 RepID=A0AA39CKN3_9EURO|nr:hypothetical protein H2200_004600 [Cladophialophora chaetospira]
MIKEMVLATSSLIESNELRLSLLQENLVYQANYKRVIRHLTSAKVPSTEYILMACLLLACCDFCLGEFQTGMQHITSGIRILDGWYRSYLMNKVTTQEVNLILTELAPLFASVVQKIPTYGLSVGLHPGIMLKLVPSRELPHVPKTFSNIHQARHTLDGIAHLVVKLMHPPTDLFETASLVPQLKISVEQFRTALESFESQLPPKKRDRLEVWLSLMRAHHRVLTITATVFPIPNDFSTAYVPFRSDFEAILDEYAKFILVGPRATILTQPAMSSDADRLQWHSGFIPPLFFVATRCSIPHTRLKALYLLKSLRVQEKNWNSCIAATAAETSMKHMNTPFGGQSLAGQEAITIPGCLCNQRFDWSHVRHLIETSGYQGATMTLLADCTCAMGR